MKKTFGIIGAGNIGQAVARHLLKAGYPVVLSNSGDVEVLKPLAARLGAGASAGTPAEAAAADFVLLALPWTKLSTLTKLTDWSGRTVIDATNQFLTHGPEFILDDLNGRPSTAVVADYIPGARVVKAFNTLYYKVLSQDPEQGGGKRVLFVSGDDASAKEAVKAVIKDLGFAAVDLGSLESGSRFQHPNEALASRNLVQFP